MEEMQIPTLDISKVLSGGLMQNLGAVMEQGGISVTFPAPGVVLGGHVYVPIVPPLPLLPVFVVP